MEVNGIHDIPCKIRQLLHPMSQHPHVFRRPCWDQCNKITRLLFGFDSVFVQLNQNINKYCLATTFELILICSSGELVSLSIFLQSAPEKIQKTRQGQDEKDSFFHSNLGATIAFAVVQVCTNRFRHIPLSFIWPEHVLYIFLCIKSAKQFWPGNFNRSMAMQLFVANTSEAKIKGKGGAVNCTTPQITSSTWQSDDLAIWWHLMQVPHWSILVHVTTRVCTVVDPTNPSDHPAFISDHDTRASPPHHSANRRPRHEFCQTFLPTL